MSARILVVDDNPLNVKLLAAKLAKDYYFVSTAQDGLEAIEITKKELPDLILLDIMMPNLDGFETCLRLKADPATKHIPIVMVTALSDVKDRVRGLECGANDFLTKPINDIALMARVRSLLRLKMMMDEWRLREATAAQFALPGQTGAEEEPIQGGRVLLLESDKNETANIIRHLQTAGIEVEEGASVEETKNKATSGKHDLVMSSLDLENEDGLYLCAQLRAQETTRTLPILFLANETEIDRVARGLDLGANDYLLRPIEGAELLARTRTQIQQKRHYDRLHKNYEQNLALALVDPLTGAYNRRYLDMHLPMMFARSKTTGRPMSILSFDLDHFKAVNDTHGHAAGDVVLRETVNRVLINLRPSDLVVRMGGEEFTVIMPETEKKTALSVGERLRHAIVSTPIKLPDGEQELTISASFGVASIRHESDLSPSSVLERADAALYRAKETGRNKVVGED